VRATKLAQAFDSLCRGQNLFLWSLCVQVNDKGATSKSALILAGVAAL
jgi:hypothetical protein